MDQVRNDIFFQRLNILQCKPDYRLQYAGKYAGNQSVCRQCFSTCEVDTEENKKMCFGGSATATKMSFDMKLNTFQETGFQFQKSA